MPIVAAAIGSALAQLEQRFGPFADDAVLQQLASGFEVVSTKIFTVDLQQGAAKSHQATSHENPRTDASSDDLH